MGEIVTIFSETFLGLGIGKCEGKLVETGLSKRPLSLSQPFVSFVPTRKKKAKELIAERGYLLVLRGSGYPHPPHPFTIQPGSEFADGFSPSGGDALFDIVYPYGESLFTSFNPDVESSFDAFIAQFSDKILADYRVRTTKEKDTPDVPSTDQPSPVPIAIESSDEPSQITEDAFDPSTLEDERRRRLAETVIRPGQVEFRRNLIQAYGGRCAISGCDVIAALEAAHIIPYCGPASDHVQNGLLLRSDLHVLFDANLLAIEPNSMTIELHGSIKHGHYEEFRGLQLCEPAEPLNAPDREALRQRYLIFAGNHNADA